MSAPDIDPRFAEAHFQHDLHVRPHEQAGAAGGVHQPTAWQVPIDVRRALGRLSQALGHPKEVEALDGQSVEAALIDMAVRRLMLPAVVQVPKAVAYLDIGAGGYLDLGSDLSDEQLRELPKGRHMLAIVGTFGVDGYTPDAPEAPATAVVQVPQDFESVYSKALKESRPGTLKDIARLCYEAALAATAPEAPAQGKKHCGLCSDPKTCANELCPPAQDRIQHLPADDTEGGAA